eukprot:Rhum_TRINITY_DN15378_c9_g1::Rhum_TRINITY_DN15378_c9_g1_i1::g.154376::m.154376
MVSVACCGRRHDGRRVVVVLCVLQVLDRVLRARVVLVPLRCEGHRMLRRPACLVALLHEGGRRPVARRRQAAGAPGKTRILGVGGFVRRRVVAGARAVLVGWTLHVHLVDAALPASVGLALHSASGAAALAVPRLLPRPVVVRVLLLLLGFGACGHTLHPFGGPWHFHQSDGRCPLLRVSVSVPVSVLHRLLLLPLRLLLVRLLAAFPVIRRGGGGGGGSCFLGLRRGGCRGLGGGGCSGVLALERGGGLRLGTLLEAFALPLQRCLEREAGFLGDAFQQLAEVVVVGLHLVAQREQVLHEQVVLHGQLLNELFVGEPLLHLADGVLLLMLPPRQAALQAELDEQVEQAPQVVASAQLNLLVRVDAGVACCPTEACGRAGGTHGAVVGAVPARKAEVDEVHFARVDTADDEVARLDVAVDVVVLVHGLDRLQHLETEAHRCAELKGCLPRPLLQLSHIATHAFHHQVVDFEGVVTPAAQVLHNVRALQLLQRHHLRLQHVMFGCTARTLDLDCHSLRGILHAAPDVRLTERSLPNLARNRPPVFNEGAILQRRELPGLCRRRGLRRRRLRPRLRQGLLLLRGRHRVRLVGSVRRRGGKRIAGGHLRVAVSPRHRLRSVGGLRGRRCDLLRKLRRRPFVHWGGGDGHATRLVAHCGETSERRSGWVCVCVCVCRGVGVCV